MKKIISVIIAISLLCLSAACLAEVSGPSFIGTWVCGRAAITVIDEHPGYGVSITWGNSASEQSAWEYYCTFDADSHTLINDGSGTRTEQTFGTDGEISEAVVVYEDGAAVFSIDGEGMLIWEDQKEDAGDGMAFEQTGFYGMAPSVEEFRIAYFGMIADEELSLAKKACEALNFAAASELWLADVEALRANLLEAWEGLDEAAQSAFDASFVDVATLLDGCFEDWDAHRAEFEPEELEGRMEELMAEPLYLEAWRDLCGNTLTMGNSEG
ncbi:MAG: hypothetical protein IJ124_01935 [Clostridia bacterium]|nr:hypothetical protein [Clostridia bacterium]